MNTPTDKEYSIDIYSAASDNLSRFLLGKKGKNMLVVLGINPNTATQYDYDTTAIKVLRLADRKGYDGFLLINVYPQRETFARLLPEEPNESLFEKNLQQISLKLKELGTSCQEILCAWGESINDKNYFINFLNDIYKNLKHKKYKWSKIGDTIKDGSPRHPSRMSYNWEISTFDIQSYLKYKGMLL